MRVLLINPRSADLNDPAYWPPLGILYVAAALEDWGNEVQVCDMALQNLPDACQSYHMVGITCTTPNFRAVQDLIAQCRERWPGVPIVLGGPHVSICPQDGARLGVPAVVIGDGEDAILQVARDIRAGAHLLRKYRSDAPVDPDRYPLPARWLVPLPEYHAWELGGKATSLITARGCPYGCAFCCKWPGYERVRYRKIDNVIQEVEYLKDQGFQVLRFFDDEFNLNESRLLDLCKALEPLAIRFTCLVRANLLTDRQAEALFRAGCRMLQVGVESGSNTVLKAVHKNCTVEQNSRAREIALRHGLEFWAFFVVGLPGESPDTVTETCRWILNNRPDRYSVFTFQPYPGSPVYENSEQYAVQFSKPVPYDQMVLGIRGSQQQPLRCLVSTPSMTGEEIVAASRYLDTEIRKELYGVPPASDAAPVLFHTGTA